MLCASCVAFLLAHRVRMCRYVVATSTAALSINVDPVNDAPIAFNIHNWVLALLLATHVPVRRQLVEYMRLGMP